MQMDFHLLIIYVSSQISERQGKKNAFKINFKVAAIAC